MRWRLALFVRIMGLGLMLTGCSETEPYVRGGDWRPLGANAENLRLMVANPHDLEIGHGQLGSDGVAAGDPVARLRSGTTRPLPNSSVTDVKANDAGNPALPGTAAAPAVGSGAPTDTAGATQ